MSAPIDATAVEDEAPGTELEPVATATVTGREVTADDLVKRLDTIKDAMERAMERDVDYGVIPGTGSKPTLLKPGAEKLMVLFQLDAQTTVEKNYTADNHLICESHTIIYHAPTGQRLGSGEGVCSTMERKYGVRKAQRECPECGERTIYTSRKDDEGFFCWRNKGGCGKNYPKDDQRITSQPEGDIVNPDLPDTWNTVVKMAKKRSLIDAVLNVTGASAIFTQDLEDMRRSGDSQSSTANADNRRQAVQAVQSPPTEKPLGKDARERVLAAIRDAGEPIPLMLAAVGASSAEGLTKSQAQQVRVLLDKAKEGE